MKFNISNHCNTNLKHSKPDGRTPESDIGLNIKCLRRYQAFNFLKIILCPTI